MPVSGQSGVDVGLSRRCLIAAVGNYYLGFFAHLNWCLELLCHCEAAELAPFFILTSDNYLDPERGDNWFAYYFEHRWLSAPQRARLEREVRDRPEIVVHIPELDDFKPVDYDKLLDVPTAARLVETHLRVRAEISARVDTWWRQAFCPTDRVLGVHYRGTDKRREAEHTTYDEMFAAIDRYLSREPFTAVFVATDEVEFRDCARARLSDRVRVCAYSRALSRRGQPPVHKRGDRDPYTRGEEALIDCLLLARCDLLIKTASFLSAWSVVFNPALRARLVRPPRDAFLYFPDRDIPSVEP